MAKKSLADRSGCVHPSVHPSRIVPDPGGRGARLSQDLVAPAIRPSGASPSAPGGTEPTLPARRRPVVARRFPMAAGSSGDAVLEGRSGQWEEVEDLSDHVQGRGPVRPDRRLLELRLEGRFAAEVSNREGPPGDRRDASRGRTRAQSRG